MPKPLIVSLDQAPAPLKMVGEEVVVLASGAQTGSYEIFRQAGPEGSGPPPHRHAWDEAFYVIDGEVMFGVDAEQDLVARPGTLVHVPGGSTHWFRFGTGGGAMISMTSRRGRIGVLHRGRSRGLPDRPGPRRADRHRRLPTGSSSRSLPPERIVSDLRRRGRLVRSRPSGRGEQDHG